MRLMYVLRAALLWLNHHAGSYLPILLHRGLFPTQADLVGDLQATAPVVGSLAVTSKDLVRFRPGMAKLDLLLKDELFRKNGWKRQVEVERAKAWTPSMEPWEAMQALESLGNLFRLSRGPLGNAPTGLFYWLVIHQEEVGVGRRGGGRCPNSAQVVWGAREVARDEFSGGWVRAGSSWGLGLHSSHGSSHL